MFRTECALTEVNAGPMRRLNTIVLMFRFFLLKHLVFAEDADGLFLF